jgi:hypothetical protein
LRIWDLKVVAGIALAAALGLPACTARPERATLDEFFTQSRLLDKTALQHISTVIFDPQADGIVERFDISGMSKEENNTKTVTVSAQVRMPGSGGLTEKTILLTLAKGILKNDAAARGRWIVTGFIERAGKPATPRS